MNVLFRPELLTNQYLGMRHGFSKSNAKNIIACNIDRDNINEGLTGEGKIQVEASALDACARGLLHKGTIIFSSDFQRCRETAKITAEVIGSSMVRFIHLLRERDFGTLNKKGDENYKLVWEADLEDQYNPTFGGQSTYAVHQQNLEMFANMEGRYFNKQILFVSHGDPLNIMMTTFMHIKPNLHRTKVAPWQLAEIKEFSVL